MQKLSTIKINLIIKGFQGVPIQVRCSKLGTLRYFIKLHLGHFYNTPFYQLYSRETDLIRLLLLLKINNFLFIYLAGPLAVMIHAISDSWQEPARLYSGVGLLVLLACGFIFSKHPGIIREREREREAMWCGDMLSGVSVYNTNTNTNTNIYFQITQ